MGREYPETEKKKTSHWTRVRCYFMSFRHILIIISPISLSVREKYCNENQVNCLPTTINTNSGWAMMAINVTFLLPLGKMESSVEWIKASP